MYSIAIPSLSRYSIINSLTISTLEKHNINPNYVTIFVIQEEYELYKQVINEKYKIIVGRKGLVQQREFIENYYPPNTHILFLDDDIKSIDLSLCKTSNLDHFIASAFNDAINNNTFIWSVYPVFNKFFRETKTYQTFCLNYMVGAFYGIINRPNDPDLKLCVTTQGDKEDVERSILYFKKDGRTLRYNQIGFETKYYGSVGGLGTLKNRMNSITENTKNLFNKYQAFGKIHIRKNGIWEFVLNKTEPKSFSNIIVCKTFPDKVFTKLYNLLNGIKFDTKNGRNNRRGFPKHEALVFGITRHRFQGTIGLSVASLKYPDVLEELENIATIINPNFIYDSVHINHNVVCPKHKDETNVGESMLISIGEYSGCNIVIENEKYDSHNTPIIFNGSLLEHYNTDDLVGNKYSLVYYKTPYK
jgi:hypothetical protein